jgi:hypothetical protein
VRLRPKQKATLLRHAHKVTAFSPIEYRNTDTGAKWVCVCKQTQTPPFCAIVSRSSA